MYPFKKCWKMSGDKWGPATNTVVVIRNMQNAGEKVARRDGRADAAKLFCLFK
jgi:hypothetical protein